jgi:hypothetical protein
MTDRSCGLASERARSLAMNDASIVLAAALGLVFTAGAILRDTRYRIGLLRDIGLIPGPGDALTTQPAISTLPRG